MSAPQSILSIRRLHSRSAHAGFTLVEVLIVVVVMTILAGVAISKVGHTIDDAKSSAMLNDESIINEAINRYMVEHDGKPPTIQSFSLPQLLTTTDDDGNIGLGADYPHGPYLPEIPANQINLSKIVRPTSQSPPNNLKNVKGWRYNASIGRIWGGHKERSSVVGGVCP